VRLAVAEAQWQAQSRAPLDAERDRLAKECESLRAKLAEAERKPAPPSADALRQQIETALAGAKAAWKSDEAGRLALAEETWRSEANASLARATARAESAEAALAQARTAASNGQYDQAFIDGLRREIETLQRAIADREVELAQARLTLEARHLVPEQGEVRSRIALERSPRGMREPREANPANRRILRDVAIVFAVVVALFFAFPFVVPYLPYDWQVEIYNLETGQAPAAAPAAAPAPAAPRHVDVPVVTVLRAVNVRQDPSAGAAVVARLKRGATVTPGETQGNWTRIKTGTADGWVFSSYLDKAASPPAR
jgi:hypothetical protein